jgi:hypothetical protein
MFNDMDEDILHKFYGPMIFVAFPANDYDEFLSGYQPGQIVGR